MGVELTLEAREFIHYLGAASLRSEFKARQMAREILPYLEPRGSVNDWITILYNPDLRALAIGAIQWLNRKDDDMEWALLFTRLEDTLDLKTKNAIAKKSKELLDDGEKNKNFHNFAITLGWVFSVIGRETATCFTNDLLNYAAKNKRRLFKEIKDLCRTSIPVS